MLQRFLDRTLQLSRLLHVDPLRSVGFGELREPHGRAKAHAVLGKPQGHLFPQGLAERSVVADEDLDGEIVPRGRMEFGHEHGESSISDEGDALPARVGDLGRHGVGKAGGHRGQIARQGEPAVAPDLEVTGGPGGDRAGVAGQDGVVGGEAVDHRHEVLRLDRFAVGGREGRHLVVPLLTLMLSLLQVTTVGLAPKQRNERPEGQLGVADQRRVDRQAVPDPRTR